MHAAIAGGVVGREVGQTRAGRVGGCGGVVHTHVVVHGLLLLLQLLLLVLVLGEGNLLLLLLVRLLTEALLVLEHHSRGSTILREVSVLLWLLLLPPGHIMVEARVLSVVQLDIGDALLLHMTHLLMRRQTWLQVRILHLLVLVLSSSVVVVVAVTPLVAVVVMRMLMLMVVLLMVLVVLLVMLRHVLVLHRRIRHGIGSIVHTALMSRVAFRLERCLHSDTVAIGHVGHRGGEGIGVTRG